METKNLIKKFEKVGKVSNDGRRYWVENGKMVASWLDQEGYAICLKVRRENDRDDMQSDYSAGHFFDTIKRALQYFTQGN